MWVSHAGMKSQLASCNKNVSVLVQKFCIESHIELKVFFYTENLSVCCENDKSSKTKIINVSFNFEFATTTAISVVCPHWTHKFSGIYLSRMDV